MERRYRGTLGRGGARLEPGSRDSAARTGCLILLLGVLLALCWLFPVTGDDWFREELGRGLKSPRELLETVASGWLTYNGRAAGNLLAYAAGGRKVLREVLRALITLGTVSLAARNCGFRTAGGVLLAAAALLALPRAMFAQIYPWAAGFFNYVPPVLLLLAAFWLLRGVFEGRDVPNSLPRAGAVFLLGFVSQFFIENDTLYALWAGVVLAVWYRLSRKSWSAPVLAFLLGTALGALLLFLSPSYGLIWGRGGAYGTDLGQGSGGVWATVLEQQGEVCRYLASGCPVLVISLTGLLLAWLALSRRRGAADWGTGAALLLGGLYFAVNWFRPLAPQAEPLAVLVWGLALGVGAWRWLPGGAARNRFLFFWAGSAVAAAPLLVVSPIGARCLYLSYVCLLVGAGNLLAALPVDRPPLWLTQGVPLVLAAVVVGSALVRYYPIHQVEEARTALLEQAVAQGEREVLLPAYPDGDWLWEGDSVKVTSRYYIQTPGDMAVDFVPADQWPGL